MNTAINELEGFEVFIPYRINFSNEIVMSITKSGCHFTRYALEVLRDPQYVLTFFDYKTKRLMIIPGKKGMENIIKLSNHKNRKDMIYAKCFLDELIKMTGINFDDNHYYKVTGHQPKVITPTLIFDLNNLQMQPSVQQKKGE